MSHDEVIDRADADLDQDAPAPLDVVLQVEVVGPVRTQELGVYVPSTRSLDLVPDQVEQLLTGDPRRSQVILISTSADFYVSSSRSDVEAKTAAKWPASLPLRWRGRGPIYVRNGSAVIPTTVSAISETLQ